MLTPTAANCAGLTIGRNEVVNESTGPQAFFETVILYPDDQDDPKHLGARIGMTSVLHTWGSAMTHHPHVHVIVPGGGLSPDGARWIACRPGFLLPVKVLSRLFRRLFLEGLAKLHKAGN